MKDEIHPEYFESKVTCAGCSTTFTTGSVMKEINIGVCSECHPFYTGKSKVLDSEGRVDQFQRKFGKFLEKQKAGKKGGDSKGGEAEAKEAAT